MAEPLGGVIQGYVVVAASQNGVEEQWVNVGFEIAAVHLDRKLVAKDQGHGEGPMFIIILLVALRCKHNLLQADQIFVRDGQGHIGNHLDSLGNKLLAAGTPNLFAVIAPVRTDHFMDSGKGLAAPEQAGIGHQFTGGTEIIFLVLEVEKHVSCAGPDQEKGMEYRTAERREEHQGHHSAHNHN